MSTEEKPVNNPPKSFQEMVVEAIKNGDLQDFRRCCVGKNDINRRLLPHKDLKPIPKYNPNERYLEVKGPTMVMFAILCERDDILQMILEQKQPDLSICVEGYNALHLAAMTKDFKCLRLLLQNKWIQENIDFPVELHGTTPKENEFTTALHIAVSNRRYANAILLLDDTPVNPKKTKEGDEEEEEEELGQGQGDADAHRNQANVNQKSTSGSTPLYIATYLNDLKMVRILLSAGADPTIICGKGATAQQLAEENQKKNNERKQRQAEREKENPSRKGKHRKEEKDDIDEIVDLFRNGDDSNSFPNLKQLYAPELVEEKDKLIDQDGSDDEEEEDEDDDEQINIKSTKSKQNHSQYDGDENDRPKQKPKKSKNNGNLLKKILSQLNQINARLDKLERGTSQGVGNFPNQSGNIVSPPNPDVISIAVDVCNKCGAAGAKKCPNCNNFYCDKCTRLSQFHPCHQ
ncbi:hypothetical protein TRFO_11155 [Tritrichomonas foetus]|uniref:Ankyrin repeat protein n=1 Tax=Tritrichomonas foetus TaxID=1144522 RepID=A0A1J4J5I6_9EUKA|nr:hypothetical protein TRFO_11155 [Tritrichomonas foetus]|eukprot:OHS94510.1 hypothetical protein TRFO_11155 [Tritrichomonas foetus]